MGWLVLNARVGVRHAGNPTIFNLPNIVLTGQGNYNLFMENILTFVKIIL